MRVVPVPCRVGSEPVKSLARSLTLRFPHLLPTSRIAGLAASHAERQLRVPHHRREGVFELPRRACPAVEPTFSSCSSRTQTKTTAVVDPFDPPKLQAAAEKEGVRLGQFLLTTHGHHDHAGGNEKTTQLCVRNSGFQAGSADSRNGPCSYPNIKVYAGGENVSAVTEVVRLAFLLRFPFAVALSHARC